MTAERDYLSQAAWQGAKWQSLGSIPNSRQVFAAVSTWEYRDQTTRLIIVFACRVDLNHLACDKYFELCVAVQICLGISAHTGGMVIARAARFCCSARACVTARRVVCAVGTR